MVFRIARIPRIAINIALIVCIAAIRIAFIALIAFWIVRIARIVFSRLACIVGIAYAVFVQ